MRCFSILFLIQVILFSYSLCELSREKQESFLNGLLDYLNNLPNQSYVYEDGVFLKSSNLVANTYTIDIRAKACNINNAGNCCFQKCTATILDLEENGITIPNNEYQCVEWVGDETTPGADGLDDTSTDVSDDARVAEEPLVKEPIQLDNEIQPNNVPTSGEQFIAIPRDRSRPCIGCSTHVDPSAAGVAELAALGAKHLDKHEPNVKHTVVAVHDVERLVQVVNGIRYILTLAIGYNNCTDNVITESCAFDKICKVSVITKPWIKLSDGSKYKAIVANNCTEQWLFGDDGEPMPETLNENPSTDHDKIAESGSADEILKVIHATDVQAQPHTQELISNEELKHIEEQIIPYSEFNKSNNDNKSVDNRNAYVVDDALITSPILNKSIQNTETVEKTIKPKTAVEHSTMNTNDIDALMNLYNFADFQPLNANTEDSSRGKRSYSTDLQIMSVLEKLKKIKRNLNNAEHVYKLGKFFVDYLNEMDMEVKTRVLKEVIFAEEEIETDQHFFYIRVKVEIPCDKVECDNKDTVFTICNGVIDSTRPENLEVVDTFCYKEEKNKALGQIKQVPIDDPILLKLTNKAIKKIEDDMHVGNALRVAKIINANTQKVSGTVTKISMILEFADCNKTVPFYRRENCSIVQNLGTKICDVEIHERYWIKDEQITYTCTDRLLDETIEEKVIVSQSKYTKDPKVMEIVNEALQILEVQSNKNNKQKIVEISSVSTQTVAGQLINVNFVVGYTKCLITDIDIDANSCDLVESEKMRKCQAQVWERPWLQEGRQMKVVCDDTNKTENNEIENRRRKRSSGLDSTSRLGGINEVDAKDPKYMKLAQESLSKYLQDSGNTNEHSRVVKIEKVTEQVVAGKLTVIDFTVSPQGSEKVYSCHSRVWSRPWLKSKEINVTCENGQESRQKRQLTGGIVEVDPNNPEYMKLAQESLLKYLQDSGNTKQHRVVKIERVGVQLVSGTLTYIDFKVSPDDSREVYSCHSEVWEISWQNFKQINVTCDKDQGTRQKRHLAGGITEVDPNNPEYMKLAQESLSKYLQDSGNTNEHSRVVKIEKVTEQVVAGKLTVIDFTVSPQGSEKVYSCHSRVWSRPWLKSKEINVTCENGQESRQKRQLTGGIVEVDPNNPEYMKLAQESLLKYLQDSGNTKQHRVVKIERVGVQLVSGTLTYIDFKVSPDDSSEVYSCHSEVWERSWLNFKQINVTCEKDQGSRQKRQLAGGITEVDPNNPEYMKLAQESLSKYLQDSGNTNEHRVVKIEKVTRQVVAGELTVIDFTVSRQGSEEVFSCKSKVWERSWLNSKEINVTCDKDQGTRQKRQLAGGITEVDPNNPEYMKLAQESLSKYLQDSGNTNEHSRVVKIEKVTEQVVAGKLTVIDFTVSPQGSEKVYSCHSRVWSRPWLKSKEINVTCENGQESRQKRQLTGGIVEVDPNNPEYMKLAQESLLKYLQDSGNTKQHRVVKIERVGVQLVSGTLTYIDFKVSPDDSREVYSCHSEVWEISWQNFKQINVTCDKDQGTRQKRHLAGGITEVDPNNPEYMKLAQESLSKYLQDSGNTNEHSRVVKIEKVTEQVVAGKLTVIDFTVSPQGSEKVYSCHSRVWSRPWLKSKEINVTCENGQESRQKRQLTGGIVEVDPNNPEYMKLAQESLLKYLQDSGNTKQHRVVKIERVGVQLVSGTLTYIDFKVSPDDSSEVYSCHSEVWERSWLNFKQINVTCEKDQGSRQKRQLAGGITEVDPNNPEYMKLAQESLSKYLQDSGNTNEHRVVKIEKVTRQVVAGELTVIDFTVSRQGSEEVFSCKSKVWERSWLNSKEINVTCDKDQGTRQKRQLAGGITEVDPNNPEYMKLAQESLSKYLQDSGNTNEHRVVKIEKVTRQVVAGELTVIDFTVSPQGSEEVFSCKSKVWERSWLKSKEINVTCENGQESRQKRQLTGGITEVDPNNPKYMKLAQESLSKYLLDSGNTNEHRVVKIEKVAVQLVAGTLTYIDFKMSPDDSSEVYSCHSEVWERPWLNKTEVTNITCSSRTKRETIVGGAVEEDPTNEKYIKLAEESLNKYVENIGNTKLHKLIELNRVKKQLVSGTITRLDFVIAPTNCDVQDKSRQFCDVIENEKIRCHSDIWERPWLKNDNKIIDVYCDDLKKENENAENLQDEDMLKDIEEGTKLRKNHFVKKGGRRPGDAFEQDPTKSMYRVLADEALRKYQLRERSSDHHEITRVNRVATKVVSGMKYMIEFEALRVSCQLNEINKTECNPKNNVTLTCHAVIWSRPWLKSKEINVDCSSGDSSEDSEEEEDASPEKSKIKKRQVSFNRNTNNKDPNDPTYLNLASEAVKKYQKKVHADYMYKVNKILRVTELVVSGFLTNLDFTISPTTCLISSPPADINGCQLQEPKVELYCSAEVYEQAVPRTTTIKVGCRKPNKKKNKEQTTEVTPNREKRESPYDDDYVDEDIKYYYADRAINDFNSRASTNNLYKVVSIHDVHRSVHMDTLMVRMYLEIAMTFCMRYGEEHDLQNCDEIDGMSHKLCLARVYPSPDDELVVQHATMTCDDDKQFEGISGMSIDEFIKVSIAEIEKSPDIHYKLVPLGEPNVIPSLNYKMPIRMSFVVHHTNCTKDMDLSKTPTACVINPRRSGSNCHSLIYMMPNTRTIKNVVVKCAISKQIRAKRSVSLDPKNATVDDLLVQKMVQESIEKLEMASQHKYKQRVLVINSYATKIVSGRLTTIDFDVGYTTCLKYEWVENMTSCEFLEHLPRRHCISHVWERLWVENGRHIEVNCEDDETPLEAHIEFESAENAMQLANEALKHIEAKYPNPRRQKIVRIFSLEKQAIAGLHYRMKVEVGVTDCMALSIKDDCKLVNDKNLQNKFCRVNVWLRPWTDHPPSFRVTCDYQSGAMDEIYHQIQAERLFYDFLTTYRPEYLNDASEMKNRFAIFKENVRKIHELNIYERGTARYAVTRFADLSYEEFSSRYLGLKPGLQDHNQVPMRMADIPEVELPDKYDWRDYGAVTPVKDQGSCGSCWAFSVTGNIEGQWKLQSGKLVSLSEQELVDCDDLDNGCNGGLPDNAYRAIEKLGGLELENDYPYEGTGDKCAFNKSLSRVHISGAVNITSNETDMAKWLTRNGPISIGINANAMQFYVGGISHPWKMLCNPKNLDHGVLIVGYGVKDYPLFHKHLPYWTIKNSWGERWGEQGYYRVFRGDGTCGVNQMASSAVI